MVKWQCCAGLLLLLSACGGQNARYASVVVLGIDGMDPGFLEAHWKELPNLDRLRREGEFQRLGTTFPPQSPVAWSTFITGTGPAEHGIYDFVGRNPKTLLPFSWLGETEPAPALRIGSVRIPLGSPKVHTFRRGAAFWEGMKQRGVPVTLVKVPMDYPPEADADESLAGLGVPDMQGTFGTFTFFTDSAGETARAVSGGRIVPARVNQGRVELHVAGPVNPFRADGGAAELTMTVDVDAKAGLARFMIGATAFLLRQGEWSDWVQVEFPLVPHLRSARGMIRVYAKQLVGGFEVYVSPVNIDPEAPAARISAPDAYSRALARKAGLYYTQGIPEDTAALRQHVFSRAEYLQQSHLASREQLALLKEAVTEYRGGFLFFHFFGVDQDSHMLWGKFDGDLLVTYRMVDEAVGWVRGRIGNATFMVMSDHGFTKFTRAVNLNTWLLSQGYLRLRAPISEDNHDLLSNVDWPNTKAYAMGLNSVYLTRPDEGLLREIAEKLTAYRDPDTGAAVVSATWMPQARSEYAPDLVAGYAAGYRCSWDGALGGISRAIVEDNQDEWIGDHCVDPAVVPGVLLVNRATGLRNPGLQQLSRWIEGVSYAH